MNAYHKILEMFVPVLNWKGRYIDLWGGRGRGGSYFATDYCLALLTGRPYFRGYLVRQTFRDIRDSLFRDLKDRIAESGIPASYFHIQENEMRILYIPTGNMVSAKGVKSDGSRTANLKSLAGATHVFIEEADELNEEDFDQLDVSIRTDKIKTIQIIRVFNPPGKRHWIWRDYQLSDDPNHPGYFRATVKPEAGILSIFGTYRDNVDNLNTTAVEKLERFSATNPEYYHCNVLGLISEGQKGRVFTNWKLIEPCDFEEHWKQYGGFYVIDFGYSADPTALIQVIVHRRTVYARELLYLPGLDNIATAKRLIDLGLTYKDRIFADYGAGGGVRIAELSQGYANIPDYPQLAKGFNIYPVVKIEIAPSIGKLKGYEVFYTTDSRNIDMEVQEYRWALDKDKNPTDTPIDKFNHAIDCIRYGVIVAEIM